MEAKMTEVVDALNKFSACNNNLASSIKKIIAPQAKPVVASQAEPTASQPTAVVASQAAASQLTAAVMPATASTSIVPATASQATTVFPTHARTGRRDAKDMPSYSNFNPIKP